MSVELLASLHTQLLSLHAAAFGRCLVSDNPESGAGPRQGIEDDARALNQLGPAGERGLLSLLDSPDAWVRYAGASHSLAIDEARAKSVLVALLSEPDPLDFAAMLVLKAWSTLHVDPRTAD